MTQWALQVYHPHMPGCPQNKSFMWYDSAFGLPDGISGGYHHNLKVLSFSFPFPTYSERPIHYWSVGLIWCFQLCGRGILQSLAARGTRGNVDCVDDVSFSVIPMFSVTCNIVWLTMLVLVHSNIAVNQDVWSRCYMCPKIVCEYTSFVPIRPN